MSTDNSDAPDLLYEVRDGIGRVTFNRPAARNALTFEMYEGLAEICRTAPARDGIHALVITGAGDRAFAAGTDITLFRDFKGGEDGIAYEERMEKVLSSIESCSLPTIAAINGACTGGGAMIAALCDVRIASATLKFGFPIARTLGNCLSMANLARLVALIGLGRVQDLIFTSRLMRSDEALACGLISECLDDATAVEQRAFELAAMMAGLAPLTLRATKEMLIRLRQGRSDDDDLVTLCYGSKDFREGLDAFLAKRPPKWSGS